LFIHFVSYRTGGTAGLSGRSTTASIASSLRSDNENGEQHGEDLSEGEDGGGPQMGSNGGVVPPLDARDDFGQPYTKYPTEAVQWDTQRKTIFSAFWGLWSGRRNFFLVVLLPLKTFARLIDKIKQG
jgi:hypothetical protein